MVKSLNTMNNSPVMVDPQQLGEDTTGLRLGRRRRGKARRRAVTEAARIDGPRATSIDLGWSRPHAGAEMWCRCGSGGESLGGSDFNIKVVRRAFAAGASAGGSFNIKVRPAGLAIINQRGSLRHE